MNRPGAIPQPLQQRIPSGFGQQQPQQGGRSVSSRLPNGKLASNGSGWAFGSGVPMAGNGGGLPSSTRAGQLGGNLSFAQSLSGSQPATPLDLSEFPSLSNTSQLPNASQSSMWSSAGSRGLGASSIQRTPGTPLASQQNQGDDLFSSSTRLSANQGSFRFGNQGSIGQAPPQQPGNVGDESFPPLNRNANGEIGQERGAGLISGLGFGAQVGGPSSSQGVRSANGLLNALSANVRAAAEPRSPVGTRLQEGRGTLGEDENTRPKPAAFREESHASQSPLTDGGPSSAVEARNPLGAIGNDGPSGKAKEVKELEHGAPVHDPLAGMSEADRWGMKGMRTLMNNFPDYNALMFGMDPNALGLDLNSNEMISPQVYSLFDDVPPHPAIPKFRLPDCYKVTNVGPIEGKMSSFNEETLMWIFYSCPQDYKQQLAANELTGRNWRWHKKLQLWLTKDDMMQPQVLGPGHERGHYIVWDTVHWRKERRELMLLYADLDTGSQGVVS